MTASDPERAWDEQVISHLTLRILIGITGILLPLIIAVVRFIGG